jgi:hypothetical protein
MKQTNSWLKPGECRILEDIAHNPDIDMGRRVLAWAWLKSWGNGQEFACCRVGDLTSPLGAPVLLYTWRFRSEDDLIAASQQQCATDLENWNWRANPDAEIQDAMVTVNRVRAAVNRLVKLGLLTTEWVRSLGLSTKYQISEGTRAHLVHQWVKTMRPVRVSPRPRNAKAGFPQLSPFGPADATLWTGSASPLR